MVNVLVGTILTIGATQDLTSKSGIAFKRRDLIIMLRRFDPNTGEPVTDTENTPQLSFMGDRCAELDSYQPGQVVAVSFDIQGRKYTDQQGVTKIINDIRPYKIELYQPKTFSQPQAGVATQQAPVPTQAPAPAPQAAPANPGYGQPYQAQQPQQQQSAPQGYGQQGGGYKPPF